MTTAKSGPQSRNLHSASSRPRLAVFIGRFQPFHVAHLAVIKEGLSKADHVLVLVGTANEPRSVRNPFTYEERAQMIKESVGSNNLSILPLEDSTYNINEWIERTTAQVHAHYARLYDGRPKGHVALLGHSKDATSYYLNLFPQWGSLNVAKQQDLSATDIREQLFGDDSICHGMLTPSDESGDDVAMPTQQYLSLYTKIAHNRADLYLRDQQKSNTPDLPGAVVAQLQKFVGSPAYEQIAQEFAFAAKYKFAWRNAPYAPTFVTADAVVIQSGHVLMVRRRSFPGYGQWALPGGFVDQNEQIEQAMLRELKEETGIKLPDPVLKGHIQAREVFDAPFRSSRGRTITHAYLIHLPAGPLPKIKKGAAADASLDACSEAFDVEWKLISELQRSECFEDHYPIIKNMSARI